MFVLRRAVAVCCGAIFACACVHGSETPVATVSLDEVLVTGERPGPGMWRVSKGTHNLWILATLEPLPKKMTWRSQVVDERIAASKVVLAPPSVNPEVGFFRGLTLVPSLLRARKSPDGRTLEQSLPHDLYIRWLALRVKFLGRWSDDEHTRPILAALDLYTHALDQSGLTSDDTVWTDVEQTARRHHVPVVPVTLNVNIDDPRAAIRELEKIPKNAEIDCLAATIERLETDLQAMRQRANLWSLGDVTGLRALRVPGEGVVCLNAFISVPSFRDKFADAKSRLSSAWLDAADVAIATNDSSFAVLSITEMLQSDGLLAQLRARGFSVEEPQ